MIFVLSTSFYFVPFQFTFFCFHSGSCSHTFYSEPYPTLFHSFIPFYQILSSASAWKISYYSNYFFVVPYRNSALLLSLLLLLSYHCCYHFNNYYNYFYCYLDYLLIFSPSIFFFPLVLILLAVTSSLEFE